MIEPTRSAAPVWERSAVPSRGQKRSLAGYSVLQVGQIFSALTASHLGLATLQNSLHSFFFFTGAFFAPGAAAVAFVAVALVGLRGAEAATAAALVSSSDITAAVPSIAVNASASGSSSIPLCSTLMASSRFLFAISSSAYGARNSGACTIIVSASAY